MSRRTVFLLSFACIAVGAGYGLYRLSRPKCMTAVVRRTATCEKGEDCGAIDGSALTVCVPPEEP